MTILEATNLDQVDELMESWPTNSSDAPKPDDLSARSETKRLALWWLSRDHGPSTPAVVAEATKDKKGWHYWFQNQHPAHSKPCRSFRILIQHKKPPRVYQLQF